jgi:hypothetical protein
MNAESRAWPGILELSMATNPQFPQQRGPQRVPDVHPKLQVPNKKQFPWPILAIIAAAVILVAIIALMPTTPHKRTAPEAAQVPTQPTGSQIQLSDLKIQPAPAGGAIYVVGRLTNTGATDLTGVQVQATFKGANGQNLVTQTRPIESVTNLGQAQDLTRDPIKPNEARPFRIYFRNLPAGWNHELPEISISTVTGTKP